MTTGIGASTSASPVGPCKNTSIIILLNRHIFLYTVSFLVLNDLLFSFVFYCKIQ